jgi:hypothetical protein
LNFMPCSRSNELRLSAASTLSSTINTSSGRPPGSTGVNTVLAEGTVRPNISGNLMLNSHPCPIDDCALNELFPRLAP